MALTVGHLSPRNGENDCWGDARVHRKPTPPPPHPLQAGLPLAFPSLTRQMPQACGPSELGAVELWLQLILAGLGSWTGVLAGPLGWPPEMGVCPRGKDMPGDEA